MFLKVWSDYVNIRFQGDPNIDMDNNHLSHQNVSNWQHSPPHSENIMGSCFDAGVGVQIKCLHYYPVFLSNERDILHITTLCGNIKISEIKKKKMVWPIIQLNSAVVRYFKLKCKIPFLFKDNTLPSGLCCKIFNGWRWTGSVWRHSFKKLKPPLTSRWLQAWHWSLQDKLGQSHDAHQQGAFRNY